RPAGLHRPWRRSILRSVFPWRALLAHAGAGFARPPMGCVGRWPQPRVRTRRRRRWHLLLGWRQESAARAGDATRGLRPPLSELGQGPVSAESRASAGTSRTRALADAIGDRGAGISPTRPA